MACPECVITALFLCTFFALADIPLTLLLTVRGFRPVWSSHAQ
jgi:hypothetical protein